MVRITSDHGNVHVQIEGEITECAADLIAGIFGAMKSLFNQHHRTALSTYCVLKNYITDDTILKEMIGANSTYIKEGISVDMSLLNDLLGRGENDVH